MDEYEKLRNTFTKKFQNYLTQINELGNSLPNKELNHFEKEEESTMNEYEKLENTIRKELLHEADEVFIMIKAAFQVHANRVTKLLDVLAQATETNELNIHTKITLDEKSTYDKVQSEVKRCSNKIETLLDDFLSTTKRRIK